jgi:type IV pilus assembly protein PilA
MIAKLKRLKRGFTLVELMIVVAIVGVLAALAVYGVSKYVKNAKTAEARNGLGRLSKDASTAFNKEGMTEKVMELGASTGISTKLCEAVDSADIVPDDIPAAAKYQSKPTDWMTGTSSAGWTCLKFSMTDPQYFQYNYTTTGDIANGEGTFTAVAAGDLDGDAITSNFWMTGEVKDESGKKVAVIAPNLGEDKPDE